MPSRYVGTESISISGVTGGSQQLTVLEAEVSLTGNGWQKHPIVTGPEAPCILGIDYLRNGYFKDPKGYRWAFGIAAVETEDIRQLNTLPGLSDDSCAVGLLRVEEQQVPIATTTVHRRQYRTDRDSVTPIHEMIRKLESQGVVSKARSPFNSPIWPVRKSSGEWRLTVDYRALNEVTPPLSAAVPDMLELQYELESKAAKWYATIDIANAFFSIPLAAECRAQFAFTWKGVQYTWNRLPQGWKHSPTICHGLIQTTLEKAGEVFEKGEKIIQILLKAGFAIKRSKVKGPAQEIQFLGVKWQDGRRQIPTEVINKIIAMSPPTSKKETQAFLGAIGFWRMHIPEYSQIVSPLYLVTRKKNDFHWGPEQQQAFAQIKQEIAHAVALGPVRTGPEVKNVLYSAAGNNGLSWSLWQKVPGETRGRPLGFWSRSYRGSEANYTPTEKEILAAYEGLQAASEVIGTETQLLLAPRLPVLGWMFKGKALTGNGRLQYGAPHDELHKLLKDIAARVEKLTVKVRHVDAHVSKSQANEEHHNNEQVDKVAKSFKLWVAAWRQQLREALPSLLRDPETAVDDNGNPLTLEHLMGEGRWADPSDQTSDIPIKALQIAREHAVSAFFGMVPDGPVVPYYKIMQGAKESFTKFVERLTRAIEVQVTEVAPILVTSSRHEPYRLRLTEALYLRTADWTFLSINTKEQGAWPVQGKELVIIGDCKYTPQEVEILPGVLVNNPRDLVLWLRCTHPPTFIPKGQVIAQIIPTRGPNNTPVACPVQAITEERPRVDYIKDCFFQIPLHPDDAPRFAFSVPTINREAPRRRYHWRVLPQGMKNSPVICQWYVASLLSPVRAAAGQAIIYHYMDDVLVCAPNDDMLSHVLGLTVDALVAAGFELQEEKVQRMPPWKYPPGSKSEGGPLFPKNWQFEQKEKAGDAIKHLIHAFSFMGIPRELKTDNGPAYKSRELRSFLQQWGVEHKTGIPHSPTGQAMVERTHGTIKRVLHQQQRVLKTESPSVTLARALFTINFLNCSYEGLNPPIVRHFGASSLFGVKERPQVMVRDPGSGGTEGPHDLVTWGRGYACVSTPTGPKWIPAKWVRRDPITLFTKPRMFTHSPDMVRLDRPFNHVTMPSEEDHEEEGLELEEVLEGTPEDEERNPDEEEHELGYPTQHH
ncbi:hypothetical protein DUI87_03645 [Hirundo rustica rustica]|uniref:ribonuclease H n=1 Tax=Hirundo rustica rustica TaxID=333673 RepID=A0A3M0L212_HIRRU|nr:hypothetical protein DUI87_03645 [Hirundo rustica rustica]